MIDPVNTARAGWIGDYATEPPQGRVHKALAALTRARRLQLLVDHGFGGLFAGLMVAAITVLITRFAQLSFSPAQLAVIAVISAVVVAVAVGWLRRPDVLDVAIDADLALKLKQRLSTAWEYMRDHGDAPLAERLAAQAVRAGLPARPALVFPLRVNRWGRLAPLAAAALLLASVLDVEIIRAPAMRHPDTRVADEGKRLSAFAREMQARAARETLPLSAKQAEQLERLGVRMEGGALARGEAVQMLRQLATSLREAGKQALAGVDREFAGATQSERDAGSSRAAGRNAREALERALRSTPAPSDARALAQQLNDLAQAGVPQQQAEAALQRHQAGDQESVRKILDRMAQIERARREYEELQNARAQVRQAQENLDDTAAGAVPGRGLPVDADEGEDRESDRSASAITDRPQSGATRGASRYGGQSDSSSAAERQPAPNLADPGKTGAILKPQGQVRAGDELITQGQVLPKVGRPSVENTAMKAEFASQVEAALSKEQYPAHTKELIRRYFLSLSQGPQGPQAPAQGAQ